jgi:hypothetical protein
VIAAVFRPNGDLAEVEQEAEQAVDHIFDRIENRIDTRIDRLRSRYGIASEAEPVAVIEAESKPARKKAARRKAGAA